MFKGATKVNQLFSYNLWLTLNFPLGRVDQIYIAKFSENLNDLNKLNNLHVIQLLFIEAQSLLTIIVKTN